MRPCSKCPVLPLGEKELIAKFKEVDPEKQSFLWLVSNISLQRSELVRFPNNYSSIHCLTLSWYFSIFLLALLQCLLRHWQRGRRRNRGGHCLPSLGYERRREAKVENIEKDTLMEELLVVVSPTMCPLQPNSATNCRPTAWGRRNRGLR